MDTAEIEAAFDASFDQAIVFHGFADYMRDYDVYVHMIADRQPSTASWCSRYRFVGCVQVTTRSALPREGWSLDDRVLEHGFQDPGGIGGFRWWVRWQELYPGMMLVPESAEAARWSNDTGLPMFEATIETNVHRLSLIFSDLVVDTVEDGYVPFRISDGDAGAA